MTTLRDFASAIVKKFELDGTLYFSYEERRHTAIQVHQALLLGRNRARGYDGWTLIGQKGSRPDYDHAHMLLIVGAMNDQATARNRLGEMIRNLGLTEEHLFTSLRIAEEDKRPVVEPLEATPLGRRL